MDKLRIAPLIAVSGIAWAVALLLAGAPVNILSHFVYPFSSVLTVVWLAWVAFDRCFWAKAEWFSRMPNISGAWRVRFTPEKGDSTVDGFFDVRQTFSKLNMRLVTAESTSELVASRITPRDDGTYEIAAVYRNTPDISVRRKSPIHHGAFLLNVAQPRRTIIGTYWTDRKGRGDIELHDRRKLDFDSFATAQQSFGEAP